MTARMVSWIMGGLAAGSSAVMACLAASDHSTPKWVAIWGGAAALFGYLAKSPLGGPPSEPK